MPLTSPSSVLLRTQSDERLLALARGGHERAFEAIVERYRRPLLRASRRILPEARAEDAVQQALVSAWGALRRGDDVRELRPWLYRVVHNTALNQLRVSGYDYAELREALSVREAPQDEVERRAVVRQTLTGLAALPERQRQALLQIAVEGRPQDEVARQLGISEGAVRQLVHRARVTLRAAATAVVPLPLANWAATGGSGSMATAERIAEAAGGAGGAGLLAKAGAVMLLAGGAVAAPVVVTTAQPDRAQATAEHATDGASRHRQGRGGADPSAVPGVPALERGRPHGDPDALTGTGRGGPGGHRRGRDDGATDDRGVGRGGGGSGDDGSGDDGSGGGPGTSSQSGGGSGTSGGRGPSGGSDDDSDDGGSGSGSDSSGSDSSGSDSSGSDSSGSDSSGSDGGSSGGPGPSSSSGPSALLAPSSSGSSGHGGGGLQSGGSGSSGSGSSGSGSSGSGSGSSSSGSGSSGSGSGSSGSGSSGSDGG